MILGLTKKLIFSNNIYFINLKYILLENMFYLEGFYGILKFKWKFKLGLNLYYLKDKILNLWYNLEVGFIGMLYLNGLGFKCTKKLFNNSIKKYWRFNIGHSQVYWYFTPSNLIMKVKQRFIFLHGLIKDQVFDTLKKLKSFHIPDSYKGVGLKFPNEYIRLKKGKIRQ